MQTDRISTKARCRRSKGSRLYLLPLLGLLFVVSCAKQGYPSGGPRDTAPPVAGKCKPANATFNFDQNQFFVEFDEYVVLKDADNNILVSPPMAQKPEYTTKGKGILVRLKDTLQPNTTYLFQFKNAIADYTEGNVLPSFEYVFSTGTTMDTLKLAGRVLDARSGKPSTEMVTVMAYEASGEPNSDSTSARPNFVTRCDKEGYFQFHYIPKGQYRLVAVVDADRNQMVGEAEAVAWDDTPYPAMGIVDSAGSTTLRLSKPLGTQQMITTTEFFAPGKFRICTRQAMQHPQLQGAEGHMHLNEQADTLTFWLTDPKCDSVQVVFTDQGLTDTLRLRYRAPTSKRRRRADKQSTSPTTPLMRSLCTGNTAYYDRLLLSFDNPIVRTADSLYAMVQNLTDSTFRLCPIRLDSTGLQARIEANVVSDQKYHVSIGAGLFIDLYGTANDSLAFDMQPKDYATLSLDIDNRSGMPLVVELLDKRDTVVAAQVVATTGGHLQFTHISTGEYRLRAVLDANADGKWTTGNYAQRQQPEAVLYFGKPLNLREKWEVREKWKVEPDE